MRLRLARIWFIQEEYELSVFGNSNVRNLKETFEKSNLFLWIPLINSDKFYVPLVVRYGILDNLLNNEKRII